MAGVVSSVSGSNTNRRVPDVPPSGFQEVLESLESVETCRDLAYLCREVARRADPRVLALLRRDAWRQARFVHPRSYREKILRSLFFALTARINQMRRLDPEEYPEDPIEGYDRFLEIVREYAEDPDYDSPLLLLYESLSAAYAIFLRGEPVHRPVRSSPE